MASIVLPDTLRSGLNVVFCGTAAGNRSAQVKAYYAGRGNQFWAVLYRIGLTPYQLRPDEYHKLPDYGVGLTDLAKHEHGNDSGLKKTAFDVKQFVKTIEDVRPKVIAFNGKRAAQEFFGHSVSYGIQKARIGATEIFVLPSTSGAARCYWNEQHWVDLARYIIS